MPRFMDHGDATESATPGPSTLRTTAGTSTCATFTFQRVVSACVVCVRWLAYGAARKDTLTSLRNWSKSCSWALSAVVPEVAHTLVFAVFLASDLVDFVITLFAQSLLVFAKYVIELARLRLRQLQVGLVMRFPEVLGRRPHGGTSALDRTAVEGDGDGIRRTPSLVWPDDVQQMHRMMLLVSGETLGQHTHGATCFSGASVDKVSLKTPRSVDVPRRAGLNSRRRGASR